MNTGTRGGKARLLGPSESPAFCAVWEAKRAAGETKDMTGSREHYARTFAWGRAALAAEPTTTAPRDPFLAGISYPPDTCAP